MCVSQTCLLIKRAKQAIVKCEDELWNFLVRGLTDVARCTCFLKRQASEISETWKRLVLDMSHYRAWIGTSGQSTLRCWSRLVIGRRKARLCWWHFCADLTSRICPAQRNRVLWSWLRMRGSRIGSIFEDLIRYHGFVCVQVVNALRHGKRTKIADCQEDMLFIDRSIR